MKSLRGDVSSDKITIKEAIAELYGAELAAITDEESAKILLNLK